MNVKISGDAESFDRWRERLNKRIEAGLIELDNGEGIPGEQAFRALREKADTRRSDAMRPIEARDFVEARLYDSEDEVIRDALRHLLRARPEARIHLAVHRYQNEDLSLAKAAELAGVSWAQMRDILRERGIVPRLGPETVEEAEKEVGALREFLARRQRA